MSRALGMDNGKGKTLRKEKNVLEHEGMNPKEVKRLERTCLSFH